MPKKTSVDLYLEAAIQLAAEVGIENVRTRMVAERVGYSEAMLFRYFRSKEELLRAAFLKVDARVSELIFDEEEKPDLDPNVPFEEAVYKLWKKVFDYLISHTSDTLYLIRFRYSSMYTDELRAQRKAYNGTFAPAYEAMAENMSSLRDREFIVNYIFELTLCFAERIISGRFDLDTFGTERLWATIRGAIAGMIAQM